MVGTLRVLVIAALVVILLTTCASFSLSWRLKPPEAEAEVIPYPSGRLPADLNQQAVFTQAVMNLLVAADGPRYQAIFCGVASSDIGTTAVWCMIIRDCGKTGRKRHYSLIFAFDTALSKQAEGKIDSLRGTPGLSKLVARTFYNQSGCTTFVSTGDEVFTGSNADPAEHGIWKAAVLLRMIDDVGFMISQAVGLSRLKPTEFFY